MVKIYIANNQKKIKADNEIKSIIKKSIKQALKSEDCDFDCEVSVTLVDNEEIKQLNKEHRNKDSVTDVLSFPMQEFDEEMNIISDEFSEDTIILGDIVLSLERAEEQADEYGHSFEREVAFLTVHSMLHLLGYDHETTKEDEEIMFKKQNEILNEMGITRE